MSDPGYPPEGLLLDPLLDTDETLVVRLARAAIDISGAEAADYLQGQISTDVEALGVGKSTMSFMLDPKGRVECLFRLTRLTGDHFLADTEPAYGDVLKESLERFKLRTKADFELVDWQMLVVRGACVGENDRSRAQGQVVETLWPCIGGSSTPGNWPAALPQLDGFDVLAEAPSTDGEVVEADLVEPILEWLRTLYGLPMMGKEIQSGAIPNETGLLDVAVSFTKGCYRGQELVERIDSRAGARRELFRVMSTESLTTGELLRDEAGKEIGTVLSAVEHPPGRPPAHLPTHSDLTKFKYAGFAILSSRAVDDERMSFNPDKALFALPVAPKWPEQTGE